jgi:competence protein ComFC
MGGIQKLLNRFGFGWVINLPEKLKAPSLSDLNPFPLGGNFDAGFALGEYSILEKRRRRTNLGELLHRFKYEQDQQSGMILADLAAEFICSQASLKTSDLMLTVPPSFKSRRFDPVSFLAEKIEEKTKIPWKSEVFARTKLSPPQKDLRSRKVKQLNVMDTFRLAKPLELASNKLLVFDDIFDSGATLNEISDILREWGAEKIYVLVLAKTRFDQVQPS